MKKLLSVLVLLTLSISSFAENKGAEFNMGIPFEGANKASVSNSVGGKCPFANNTGSGRSFRKGSSLVETSSTDAK